MLLYSLRLSIESPSLLTSSRCLSTQRKLLETQIIYRTPRISSFSRNRRIRTLVLTSQSSSAQHQKQRCLKVPLYPSFSKEYLISCRICSCIIQHPLLSIQPILTTCRPQITAISSTSSRSPRTRPLYLPKLLI